MKLLLKKIVERIPFFIGSKLAIIPYGLRLGKEYTNFSKLVKRVPTEEQILDYTILKFRLIFNYAKENIPFYKDLYLKNGVYDIEIKSIEDIKKIPIISKKDIKNNMNQFSGKFNLNTGGSSGEPFSFFVDKNAFAREWAHMHFIWEKVGYNYKRIKLTIRGKNLGNNFLKYNPVHNEFILNSYKSIEENKKTLIKLFRNRKIEFIHGYPSSIYDFMVEVDRCCNNEEKEIIKKNLQSCLLGSEFPHSYIKDYIIEKWNMNIVSWYGHSEMCIFAYDKKNNGRYYPLYSYGLAEVDNNFLIGTSFHNFDMPLIRYNTDDIVDGKINSHGILDWFNITHGRSGDYILDINGTKISLTALIFGRHHKIFNIIDFIQIKQSEKGKATIIICTNKEISKKIIKENMDLSNVNIVFDFLVRNKPYRTSSGKLPLKIY